MVKPGYKSTEFWITTITMLLAAVLGVLTTQGVLAEDAASAIQQIGGVLIGVVVPLILGWLGNQYIRARTSLKSQEMMGPRAEMGQNASG